MNGNGFFRSLEFRAGILQVGLIVMCGMFSVACLHYFVVNPFFYQLQSDSWEQDVFRKMDISHELLREMKVFSEKHGVSQWEYVTTAMVKEGFQTEGALQWSKQEYHSINGAMQALRFSEFHKLKNIYEDIFSCIKCFPVMYSLTDSFEVIYEDSWKAPRSYGGEREHEGCVLFCSREDARCDTIPIVSMTDGVIEAMGWLPLGGYRVGIRSDTGVYFYYAHLASFSDKWEVGDQVKAGEIIGYMGDTGYSEIEGQGGNFPMHLHLGIYIRTDHYEELSINPYACLNYAKDAGILFGHFSLQMEN